MMTQVQAEIDVVNGGWTVNGENRGLLESVGLMVYEGTQSLNYGQLRTRHESVGGISHHRGRDHQRHHARVQGRVVTNYAKLFKYSR